MGLRTLFTKIKSWIRRTWRKLTSIVVAVGTTIGAVFLFLASIGAITILGHSGDVMCAGTIDDPCYTYINFTAEKNFWIDFSDHTPYGLNDTLEFVPDVQSWKIQHSWLSEWKDFSDTMVYFEKNNDYQVRIVSYKVNPYDHVKWSAFDGLVGADFLADTNPNTYKETLEWNGKVLDLYPLNMEFDEKGNKILLKDDKTSNDGYTFKTISEKVTEVWKHGEKYWTITHGAVPFQVDDIRKSLEYAYLEKGYRTDSIEGKGELVIKNDRICLKDSKNVTGDGWVNGWDECLLYSQQYLNISGNMIPTTNLTVNKEKGIATYLSPFDPVISNYKTKNASFPVEAGSGTSWIDYAAEPSNHSTTISGTHTWVSGLGNGSTYASEFGAGSYSSMSNYADFSGVDSFEIAFAFNTSSASAEQTLFMASGNSVEIRIKTRHNRIVFTADLASTDCNIDWYEYDAFLVDNTIYFVNLWYSGSQCGIIVDKVSKRTESASGVLDSVTNYARFAKDDSVDFEGRIDCVSVYLGNNLNTAARSDLYDECMVVSTPADTCTYTSGDWDVLCSDDCSITSAVAIDSGNNITITGTGTFSTTKNITGWTNLRIAGTDSSNRCVVTCKEGGCFNQ